MKKNTGWYLAALSERTHGSTLVRSKFNNRNRCKLVPSPRSTPAKGLSLRDYNVSADGSIRRSTIKLGKAEKKAMRKMDSFMRRCGPAIAA